MVCSGYLRHSTSRVEPDFATLNNGSANGQLTLFRKEDDPEVRKRIRINNMKK